jgi:ubiquinone/menaquinone biosynthesis C-methylase UbiE
LGAWRATLHGIDASREMLAIARANLEKHGFRHALNCAKSDIYALPLADAMADLVTIHQVLHFLDEPQRALLEARRILKPWMASSWWSTSRPMTSRSCAKNTPTAASAYQPSR